MSTMIQAALDHTIQHERPHVGAANVPPMLLAHLLDAAAAPRATALLAHLAFANRSVFEHSQRVARLSVRLARAVRLSHAQVSPIELASLFHDVGKMGIPEAILDKPGPLTEREQALVRRHPQLGHDLMRAVPALALAADLVLTSHEAYSGTGYPFGLRGHEIPLGSRIVAVADSYDALTSRRCYRRPESPGRALSILFQDRGTHFDPMILDALHTMLADAELSFTIH